jgi:XTP/dITP diphosphohydrolase
MQRICFATNNENKLREIRAVLGSEFEILSLEQVGCHEELPENQDTLEGNSTEKARYVADHYQVGCFADDTGLEVFSLNGEPGVYSARYAGPQRNMEQNMQLLLDKLQDKTDRSARFRTVITLIQDGKETQFEGIVEGEITTERQGEEGFGYDPVFRPKGYQHTFAQMSLQEKNQISHRARAVAKLVDFLKTKD